MLNSSEKAYCRALQALKAKHYAQAARCFEQAAPFFADNRDFRLYWETTRLLLAVKQALGTFDDELVIEEVFTDGQEANLHRQGEARQQR